MTRAIWVCAALAATAYGQAPSRCFVEVAAPATAVLESHTHGLLQLTRASVVFKQVAQLPEGAASTQHATSLPPSRQPRADGG